MKLSIVIVLLFGAISIAVPTTHAQPPDSCLKLLGIDAIPDPSWQWQNPDSIRVDSCIESPTFGHWYAKRPFFFEFTYGSLLVHPAIYTDTVLELDWRLIDTGYPATRGAFEDLEEQFGAFVLIKQTPSEADTGHRGSRIYILEFSQIVDIDSVVASLKTVPFIEREQYINRSGVISGGSVEDVNDLGIGIIAYPNPSTGKVSIIFNSIIDKPLDIEIYDILGRLVYNQKMTPNSYQQIELDLTWLQPGRYFITVKGSSTFFDVIK